MNNNSTNCNNTMDAIEHDHKIKKVKESILLLKQKMCKTHDLIKQYSENTQQIDYLKSSLEIAKKEAKYTISNYQIAMDKIRELELKIIEDKEENEKLTDKINEYEINVAADKQIKEQLKCKINDLEDEHSNKILEYNLQKLSLENKIKDLEHELKKPKMTTRKKKEKKIISTDIDTAKPSIVTKSTSDIGINVSLCDNELNAKCDVQDKNIMTDEFYNMKNDPHPLFCAKCEAHLPPKLTLEKIFNTMSSCPKLIERDTSPDSTNRNKDDLSRLSVPQLSPSCNSYNGSIVLNSNSSQFRTEQSAIMQVCENVKLRNVNISRAPDMANLSSNFGPISTALTSSQNCAREDFSCGDLLAKHTSSIKEIERKIQLLESKTKKLRKLKKKANNNSCHCNTKCKDDISLNSKMVSIICKSVIELYDEKRRMRSKNKRNIDSEKCACSMKKAMLKRKQLNKTNACKNACKVTNCNETYQVRDTCNKTENATKAIDTLQCEHALSARKNNSSSDINTSSTSFNFSDESGEREFVHDKSTLHSAEVASVKDNLTSHFSADETCTSNDHLDKRNVKTINLNNETETGRTLSVEESLTTSCLNADENASNDPLDKYNIEAIGVNNKIKTGTTLSNVSTKESLTTSRLNADETTNNDPVDKHNVKAADVNNKTETRMILSNKNSIDHTYSKMIDFNAEKYKTKSMGQYIHENKIDEINANDDRSWKDDVQAIDVNNKTETRTIFLFNDDHTNDIIIECNGNINAKENIIKSKNIHEDHGSEICIGDNLVSQDNVRAIDMNHIETETTVLSNNEHFIDHASSKVVDTSVKEDVIKSKTQNMDEDKVGEIHVSDNPINKGNVKAIGVTNQTETRTEAVLSNSKSFIDAGGKIDINAGQNIINNKTQNIKKDKVGEIYASDNSLNKNNIEPIDMETKAGRISLSKNENSIDHSDEKIEEIKSKSQGIRKRKIDKVHANDYLSSEDNLEAVDETKAGRTSLSKNENSYDSKIIYTNTEENKMKRKAHIHKNNIGNRILKSIRKLKRNPQANLRINKQKNIELCSKKLRIENDEEIEDHSSKTIINLKRNLDTQAEFTIEQEYYKLCPDNYICPVKKLRIAHTPKTPVYQSTNESSFTHNTIRSIGSLVTQKNTRNRQVNVHTRKDLSKKDLTINKKSINEKNLTNAEDCLQNNITLSATDIERVSEFKKLNILTEDVNRGISTNRALKQKSSNDDESSVLHNNIINKTCVANQPKLKSVSFLDSPSSVSEVMGNKSDNNSNISDGTTEVLCSPSLRNNSIIDMFLIAEDHTNDSTEESPDETKNIGKREETCVHKETIGIRTIETQRRNIHMGQQSKEPKITDISHYVKESQNNNISYETATVLSSLSQRDSGIVVEDYSTSDSNMTESSSEIKSIDKQETRERNVCMKQQDKEKNFIGVSYKVEKFQTPMSQLMNHINKKQIKTHKLKRKDINSVCQIADKFVKTQLRILKDSTWEKNIHDDVINKLTSTCGPRIIAKCIVEFLSEEFDQNEKLDKSFTPPAPMLTPSEQKITTLLVDLEELKPTVIYYVQAGIEYNVFKLNRDFTVQVDTLTRIYVALARIQKDRERVRMMCCNALYCMGIKSVCVLYIILTCWPEVLPNAEADKGILPKSIAFLIGSMQIENRSLSVHQSAQRLKMLKNLIYKYYKYTYTAETVKDIITELMTTLKAKRIDGLDTAIILVAKRQGPSWAYKNIIESALLPMIIKNEHPCIYSAFSLLGRLLRAFPLKDEGNIVNEITEQLCDLIKSGQGSHDQQEGVISAMLCLSRQEFNTIAPFVLKWVPSESLRLNTYKQLQTFINARNPKFWNNFLTLLRTDAF